jgi:citrate lyase subunit beta/citryl-CoA lyase
VKMRTVLFSPADKPERVRKVLASGAADVVVADLEDGVAPANKEMARQAAADILSESSSANSVRAVRINAWPGSAAESDLEAILPFRPDLIVVPKCEDVQAIQMLDERLAQSGADETRFILIIETAKGMVHAAALAGASSRVAAIAFGAEDLSASVGIRRTPDNSTVAMPRAWVPIAAASAGVWAIDMITTDYEDVERCGREAAEARDLGYAGKMVIHPGQIATVHVAFSSSENEVAWATKVMAAASEHEINDGGVIAVDGKMIDAPLIEQARRILASE